MDDAGGEVDGHVVLAEEQRGGGGLEGASWEGLQAGAQARLLEVVDLFDVGV